MSSQEFAADALLAGADSQTASSLYCDASNRLSDFCAASPYRSAWACELGCSACCFQSVPVTAVEALALADFLHEEISPQRLGEIRVCLQQNIEHACPSSASQSCAPPIRCALLDEDSQCSVYPVRPLRCLGFHSLGAGGCQALLQGDRSALVPIDPQTNVAMRGIQSGLSGALRKCGKDGHYYRLDFALLRALDTPNATERWEQGEDIFAGCTRSMAIPDGLWTAPQDDGSIVELRRQSNQRSGPKIELIHIVPVSNISEIGLYQKSLPSSPKALAPVAPCPGR